MRFNSKFFAIVCLIAILVSCASIIRVSDIKERPRKYHDKLITLSGYVDNVITMPVLGIGVYELNDGTGKIWVKPTAEAPYKGDRVKVTGTIKVGFTMSGKTFGLILIEKAKEEG